MNDLYKLQQALEELIDANTLMCQICLEQQEAIKELIRERDELRDFKSAMMAMKGE